MGDYSKRGFIKGAGAAAGLLALGGARSAMAAGSYAMEYAVDPKATFDLVIIGAGNAGMPAAIFASQRGAKVLVIEKATQIGGTLYYSGGMMSAAGTKLQARKGIHDTPDMFYDDVMRLAHGKAHPPVLRRWVDNAGATLDWLVEDLGMKVPPAYPIKGTAHADFLTPRYLSGFDGGRSILQVLLPEFLKWEAAGNIRVLMRTSAEELVRGRGGRVTGVVAKDEAGRLTTYSGRHIILASGGCLMSKKVFEEYTPKPLYSRRVYPYSMGDGLKLAEAVGGVVKHGDYFIGQRGYVMTDRNFPSPQFTAFTSSVDPRHRQPWEIEVNKLGQRYIAEDSELNVLERAQTSQPGMACWLIWDQEIYDKAPMLLTSLSKEQQAAAFAIHPMFAKGGSIEEVARKMALPPQALAKTVADYNAAVAAKSDPLGRKHLPLPIAKPPFYAVECLGSAVSGHAGLDVDGEMRVVTKTGQPIPGLYAIGEVQGGWHCHGDTKVNGGNVTPALTFGRYLGMTLPLGA